MLHGQSPDGPSPAIPVASSSHVNTVSSVPALSPVQSATASSPPPATAYSGESPELPASAPPIMDETSTPYSGTLLHQEHVLSTPHDQHLAVQSPALEENDAADSHTADDGAEQESAKDTTESVNVHSVLAVSEVSNEVFAGEHPPGEHSQAASVPIAIRDTDSSVQVVSLSILVPVFPECGSVVGEDANHSSAGLSHVVDENPSDNASTTQLAELHVRIQELEGQLQTTKDALEAVTGRVQTAEATARERHEQLDKQARFVRTYGCLYTF